MLVLMYNLLVDRNLVRTIRTFAHITQIRTTQMQTCLLNPTIMHWIEDLLPLIHSKDTVDTLRIPISQTETSTINLTKIPHLLQTTTLNDDKHSLNDLKSVSLQHLHPFQTTKLNIHHTSIVTLTC